MQNDLLNSFDHLNTKSKEDILKILSKTLEVIDESRDEYLNLIEVVENIETSALWIIELNGDVFLQNKQAEKIKAIVPFIDLNKRKYEVDFDNKYFLINIKLNKNRYIVTATDLTSSKQNDRLVSMGKMASHLAHEIRNPIGSVSLLASTLATQVTPEQQEMVNGIQKAIWRVERIIQATLLFGKDVPILQFDKIGLDDIKLGIQESMQYYSYDKDINLKFNFKENISLKVNFELLLIVFQNMVYNGIDAIEDSELSEGEIQVRYAQNEEYHLFGFYDNGVDIEDESILFQPYKSTKVKGNGLGLVLSQKIIKAHFGKITLNKNKKEFLIYIKKDI